METPCKLCCELVIFNPIGFISLIIQSNRSSVMGIFPIIMNVLQFWIIDSIVKASGGAPFLDLERGDYQDREPLFTHSEDEDGDHDESSHIAHQQPERRASLSSSVSREIDDRSFTIDTPNNDEHKSAASSSRQVSDAHSYPPSLSSSFSSDHRSSPSNKGPREAKNLQKKAKRRVHPIPLVTHSKATLPSLASPTSMPPTPSPKLAAIPIADDHSWADSWDDPAEWEGENPQKQTLSTPGQWNISATHTIS